jgi:MafB19-like deaminase
MRFIPRPSFGGAHRRYDPNQPRVPAGNPDGGQWTDAGGSGDVDEFSAARRRRPMPGPEHPRSRWSRWLWAIFESLRKQERLNDLHGNKRGVVAWTEINGKEVFGVNSRSRGYTSDDNSAARRLRVALIEKHPEIMNTEDIGQFPNDAVFHAEATALLRASAENGGTLAGQTLTVFVDRAACPSCLRVLPKIGLELGNPTVTFVPAVGTPKTMRNGDWLD